MFFKNLSYIFRLSLHLTTRLFFLKYRQIYPQTKEASPIIEVLTEFKPTDKQGMDVTNTGLVVQRIRNVLL